MAPANGTLFDSLFLRFATRKELLSFYGTRHEAEALRLWCEETGVEFRDLKVMLAIEANDMGLLSEPDPLGNEAVRQTPYGYACEDGSALPLFLESEVVRSIFDLCLRGRTLEAIRQMLNEAQVSAPRGGEWHRSTVRYILRNPLYAGYRRRRGMLRKSSYPAIIGPDRFDRVQKLLSRRCRRPDQRVQTSPVLRGT